MELARVPGRGRRLRRRRLELRGIAFPFIRENLRGGRDTKILAVEPASCPTLRRVATSTTSGHRGDHAMMKMYTLVTPSSLRHPCWGLALPRGDSPIISALVTRVRRGRAYAQNPTFEGGCGSSPNGRHYPGAGGDARDQGYPRPGARGQRGGGGEGDPVNLCGTRHFDLSAYEQYSPANSWNLEYSRRT